MLCVDYAPDGLKCAPTWPTCCTKDGSCLTKGCFWRRFHQIPADKMRMAEAKDESYCDFPNCARSCWRRCDIQKGDWTGRAAHQGRDAWRAFEGVVRRG
jgi:hypothetical protein